eukprot:scaffold30263_cov17-Tisochrysis_lutea.AAC.1
MSNLLVRGRKHEPALGRCVCPGGGRAGGRHSPLFAKGLRARSEASQEAGADIRRIRKDTMHCTSNPIASSCHVLLGHCRQVLLSVIQLAMRNG